MQPILIHCTQGKDRTGLIICLALLILQVPVDAITHDYLLSEDGLATEREARLEEIASIGLGEEFAGCPANWVEEIAHHLTNTYGGISEYAKSIGILQSEEDALVKQMSVRC
jgi:protein-tyrosine phosphatase